jgi:predicted TIM-barrel fold metal-dependent hydrolase
LAEKIAPFPRLKAIVANYSDSPQGESLRALLKNPQVYFDFARANADAIKQLIDTAPERVIVGSCAPLHSVEEPVSQLNGMKVSREARRKISSANAAKLLAPQRQTSATASGNQGYAIVSTR